MISFCAFPSIILTFSADVQNSSAGHACCGSGWLTSIVIAFRLFRYSMTLRRKTCDRVRSSLAQIASTVAKIAFGNRKAVAGSDIFNVLLLVVDEGIDDVVSLNLRSGNETGRQFNGEIWTVVIFITPSRDVANNLLGVIIS